jgi:hypothetical protein
MLLTKEVDLRTQGEEEDERACELILLSKTGKAAGKSKPLCLCAH